MKILAAIFGFIVKLLAGSFIWIIVAFVASIPLGLLVLKITEKMVRNYDEFIVDIEGEMRLLYVLFAITCFIGIIISRIVAVSIKVLADKKLALKNQKL